ncbi:U3 small nucleolar ribonucleoprotein mpp10 [Diaporthe sp. PMI_573]|nr:U3 small nucleolar ribonucleoprotein mpp10 [Diaporthaceae sp. PMI_573]
MAGEGSTSSSLTSTSHTLTHPAPTSNAMAATTTAPLEAASMLAFLDSLKAENRHAFLQPPASISTASLHWAKQALDAFAGQVSDEQQAARLRDRKRKREVGPNSDILKIRKVHVDGFETGQVWQQTRRIINGALSLSENVLQDLKENGQIQTDGTESARSNDDASATSSDEDGSELASSEEDGSASGSDEDGEEKWEDAESQQGRSDVSEGDEDDGEDIEDIEDEGIQDEDDFDDFDDQPDNVYVEDPHGLNDGFFSIDDFNKQSQYFEDQDAKADPFTDQADDDDEIDWHGDPLAAPKGKASKNTKGEEALEVEDEVDEEEDEEDDDAGPTFGDMDLNAPEGASDDEGDLADGIEGDMGLDLTANDIFYNNFFAPPPRKAKAGEKPRKPKPAKQGTPDGRDVERAMDNVRRDLFDDVSDNSDEEDALSDVSAGDPKSRRSAHERRQAKLSEEIRKMEAELVAKRAWTLSGEASASARPMNSLLEEDLDFEHAGKPIPVITEEVSEDLEDLIKRRIIAGEFDGVPKRRPDADVPADVRRGLVELDDAKAKQSLAEIYEEDHVKSTNPDSYVNAKDEKLRREEKEIEAMWKDISAKLDALSSWHYKPKPAAPSLQVVADVATVAMEDAQPTTAQGVSGGESMIAPQEVYNPGKDTAENGEVVAKSGLPVARQEMSREDKLRRRRREKERIRKAGGETSKISKKAQEKKDTMAELKKGGVKVINKKGEIMDMEGKKPQAAKAVTSGSFKL